jgi:hypothetical protein
MAKPQIVKYRHLKKGELIQAGDEKDSSPDGWNGPVQWVTVQPSEIGQEAPDPQMPAFRLYRRPATVTLGSGSTKPEDVI